MVESYNEVRRWEGEENEEGHVKIDGENGNREGEDGSVMRSGVESGRFGDKGSGVGSNSGTKKERVVKEKKKSKNNNDLGGYQCK